MASYILQYLFAVLHVHAHSFKQSDDLIRFFQPGLCSLRFPFPTPQSRRMGFVFTSVVLDNVLYCYFLIFQF